MNVLLLRFGELYLKGDNRHIFESMLIKNIKNKLKDEKFKFEKTFGRYVISGYEKDREKEIISKLREVFGLYSLSPAVEIVSSIEEITQYIEKINVGKKSFKVFVKRADKKFPLSSMDFARQLGSVILSKNPHAEVDVYNPEVEIHVDIRLNGKSYIFSETIKCQ